VTSARSPEVARAAARVRRELGLRAATRDQPALRAYLGSPIRVAGVRTPHLHAVVRAAARWATERPATEARALARALWSGTWLEERFVAIELLGRRPLLRDPATWRLGAGWVDRATGWALSDSLASGPIAALAAARPERFRELVAWTRSKNLWRRRAAAYALRGWVRAGEFDRPFELLEQLLDDRERWVQRAVGTWLRECWKKDRVRTERFLRTEVGRLAPTVITVATERATKRFRNELRRATGRRATPGRGY